MMTRTPQFCRSLLIGLLAALGYSSPALAQVGPGIANLDCGDGEYFKPFAFLENGSDPKGTNVSVMVRGYFMTVFAPDSGKPPGEIAIYDVSNPKMPREVKHIKGGDTNAFRENHSLPVAIIDGKHIIAFQTIAGIQFWDFTDPLETRRIGIINLPGVNGGDYENVAWQATWQGRYLYVSGGNQGIYVIDALDPTNPKLLRQVPTSTTGGFRVGPIFALGDYLVISTMDQGGAYAILDIAVPDQPALISRVSNLPRMYSIVVGGDDRIYSAGRDGNFLTHSFTDPTRIAPIKDALIGEDQLYVAAQDHFVFLGRQNNVVKVDVSNETNPMVVGEGTLGREHPDHGQVTPMGNLIFIGNDHGSGSALFCHQRGKDETPLAVQSTFPKDEATGIDPQARIGLLFSDYLDLGTLSEQSIVVRPVGGEPLDGIYSYAFNTLSFGPSELLEADTTYEVVLAEGGLADIMGNALSEEVVVRFSTGDMVVVPPPEPPPAAGGASGTGGSGAGGLSSAGGGGMGGGFMSGGGLGVGGAQSSGGAVSAMGGALGSAGGMTPVGGALSAAGGESGGIPDDSSTMSGGCSLGAGASASTRAGLFLFMAGAWLYRRRTRGA